MAAIPPEPVPEPREVVCLKHARGRRTLPPSSTALLCTLMVLHAVMVCPRDRIEGC